MSNDRLEQAVALLREICDAEAMMQAVDERNWGMVAQFWHVKHVQEELMEGEVIAPGTALVPVQLQPPAASMITQQGLGV